MSTASSTDDRPADAKPRNWVDLYAPAAFRPFFRLARFDRPIGAWLLLLPGWWGVALGAKPGSLPDLNLLILFLIGAWAMRGAGCTYNDIVDRDYDARVLRTSARPIPSGQVSVLGAAIWMLALSLAGLAVLLQLNGLAVLVGLASLAPIAAYPFMKRYTYWPQAFLGVTFNWGVPLGYAAAAATLDAAALVLYLGAVAWTIAYDTIYAHQDKEDDALIGVKSTALLWAEKSRAWIGIFYGLAVLAFAASGVLAGLGSIYFAALIGAAAILGWQTMGVEFENAGDCLQKFRANKWVGLVLFAGIVLDRL
jgi:4-hydroxybenzoate polyprenyltransferase